MKRSEINCLIGEAREFFAEHRFLLPPFAGWSAAQWQKVGTRADEIRQAALGWDITDFGSADFYKMGLILFTVRNGIGSDPASKTYCEKIMMVREDQVTPMHFHSHKMEDIINRGGGRLALRFYYADEQDRLNQGRPLDLQTDGVTRRLAPGEVLLLAPGESVTIPQRVYHDFWAAKGSGAVMTGEVSSVNDDRADNHFLQAPGRFPQIEEDEAKASLLCSEYP